MKNNIPKLILTNLVLAFVVFSLSLNSSSIEKDHWQKYDEFKLIDSELTFDRIKTTYPEVRREDWKSISTFKVDSKYSNIKGYPCWIDFTFNQPEKRLIEVNYTFNSRLPSSSVYDRHKSIQKYLEMIFGDSNKNWDYEDNKVYRYDSRYWEIKRKNFKLRVDHHLSVGRTNWTKHSGSHRITFRFDRKGIYRKKQSLSISSSVNPMSNTGLIAHYSFNGNANDDSGNNHHGIVNGASLASVKLSNSASAYSFDGVDDYISVPFHTDFNLSQGTWMATLYMNRLDGMRPRIIHKWDTGKSYILWIRNNKLGLILKNPKNYSEPIFEGNTILTTHKWYHLAATYDGSYVRFYVNGKLDGEIKYSDGIAPANTGNLGIGRREDRNENPFSGYIDDVRIYNRALSNSEIFKFQQKEDTVEKTKLNSILKISEKSLQTNKFDEIKGLWEEANKIMAAFAKRCCIVL